MVAEAPLPGEPVACWPNDPGLPAASGQLHDATIQSARRRGNRGRRRDVLLVDGLMPLPAGVPRGTPGVPHASRPSRTTRPVPRGTSGKTPSFAVRPRHPHGRGRLAYLATSVVPRGTHARISPWSHDVRPGGRRRSSSGDRHPPSHRHPPPPQRASPGDPSALTWTALGVAPLAFGLPPPGRPHALEPSRRRRVIGDTHRSRTLGTFGSIVVEPTPPSHPERGAHVGGSTKKSTPARAIPATDGRSRTIPPGPAAHPTSSPAGSPGHRRRPCRGSGPCYRDRPRPPSRTRPGP